MQDECHLLWGDVCGYIWGKKGEKVKIPMTNYRYKQTFYGFINMQSQEFRLFPYKKGNGDNTVDFLKKVQAIYPKKRIIMLWDGASYHKGKQVKAYLKEQNEGLEEKDWKIQCLCFAPHAPEQNPVEDIWLKGKNFLRRNFGHLTSFAKTKKAFQSFLDESTFQSQKFQWYF